MYETRAFKLRAIFKPAPPFTFSWAFLGPLPPSHDVHTSSSQQISVGSLGPLWSLLCMCTTSDHFTVCEDLSSILSLSHLPEVSTKSMASLSVYHSCQTGLQLQVCRARDTPSPNPPPPVTRHKHLHFPKRSSKSTEPSWEQQWSCWFLQPALPWLNNLAHRAEEGKRQEHQARTPQTHTVLTQSSVVCTNKHFSFAACFYSLSRMQEWLVSDHVSSFVVACGEICWPSHAVVPQANQSPLFKSNYLK